MGKFIIRKTASGTKFDLRAANGQVIATSEVYSSLDSCRKGIESVKKHAAVAGIEDQSAAGFEELKHPKFEVYVDKAGEFRFRLKANNGQIIAVGEGYTTKDACLKGVESVKKNAPDAGIEEE